LPDQRDLATTPSRTPHRHKPASSPTLAVQGPDLGNGAGATAGTLPVVVGNAAFRRILRGGATADAGGWLAPHVATEVDAARGGGTGLPEHTTADLGRFLGADFSAVRVHTDTRADELNRAVQATAFTSGNDIFFSRGSYQPDSASGRELLAHELTHVVQQATGAAGGANRVSDPGEPAEVQAREVARTAVARTPTAGVPAGALLGLQRTAGNRAVSGLLARSPAPVLDRGVDVGQLPDTDTVGTGQDLPAGGPGGQPPADPQTEISREEPRVQAPTAADVSQPAPASLIEQQGGVAVQSLSQVAAQAAGPAPPVAPLYTPDPLPPVDLDAAVPDEVAASAATAVDQRDVAESTAGQSAADLSALSSLAGTVAATSVLYQPTDGVADSDQQRAAASDLVSSFLTTVGARAAEVTGLGTAVSEQYRTASATAVERISAVVDERIQAIAGHLAQLRAQAQAQAESARQAVAARHTAARAAITSSTATAREQLESEYTSALQAIDARAAEQLQILDQRYQAGDERFRAAGRTVGDEAVQRGNQMAVEYMSGLVDKDDSFLDGPLTYNRGKARADTAHEISKAYQSGLVDEANKQADQAQRGKARDIDSVHATATQARESLRQQHTATLATVAQADTAALQQADNALASLTDGIAQALAGGQQMLGQLEVSLTGNVRAAAQAQTAGIEQQASDLTTATQGQISQAVASLIEVGTTISARVQGVAAPPLDQLTTAVNAATVQLDSAVAAIHGEVEQSQALGVQQLTEAGQAVVDGFGTSTGEGLDAATGSAADLLSSIQSIVDSAAGTFETIQENHDSTLATATAAATSGYSQVVTGVERAYDELARGLEQGFAQSAAGLEQGLRGALTKMEEEIQKKAKENADAVPPRWKSFVKWVLIIAVVVVVALVIGPFVIGAVGAALGTGAVMTGIIAGAIVGAATGATIQVINNWASNRPLGEGVLKAAVIGAIGGAVGGGFGAYFSSAAQAGTTVVNTAFRQFLANTAINVATETVMNVVTTGHFSWEALGWSVLLASAIGLGLHGAGGLKRVQGIQEASVGAGESFGGSVRTGMGGAVSINYRPTTPESTTSQQPEESGQTRGGGTVPVDDLPDGTVMYSDQPMSETQARVMYDNARTDSPHNEVAVYRNSETGECIVVQGNNEFVDARASTNSAMREFMDSRPGEPGRWDLVEHSHPVDPATNVTLEPQRYPSGRGGDFELAKWQSEASGGQPVEQTIGIVTERGNETVRYGYDPNDPRPYSLTYPGPEGTPVTERFASMEAYGEWYENQPGTGGGSPHVDGEGAAGAAAPTESDRPITTGGAGPEEPERRAWVHPEDSEEGRFHPLPDDVPVVYGRGSGLSEGETLTTYADAVRSGARKNPATAAARGETGPYIRDNLYTGKDLARAVDRLQEQGVLEVPPEGGSVRVVNPDRYLEWLERAYRQHGQTHLDPRMREAVLSYVGRGEPLEFFGTNPETGAGSSGGPLPGTHAELLAINDLLVAGDAAAPASVSTVRARTGDHFAACVHCGGIIDLLPPDVRVRVWTGRATRTP